jgi:hypothetical protein
MVMITGRQLVVRRSLAKVGGIDRSRSGESVESAVHGAAWKTRLCLVKLRGDLIGGAVAAQSDDGVVDLGPLGCPAHTRGEHLT